MTVRDPDLVQVIDDLQRRLAALEANVVSRWGRVPHVAADPATPADGQVWIRSDDKGSRYRTNGTTVPLARGVLGVHTLTSVFSTAATHTTYQDEGLTVTTDDLVGRRFKFTLAVNVYVPGGANGVTYRLLRDGVSMREWYIPTEALSTGTVHSMTLTHVETVAVTHAGTVFKVQIAAFATNTQVASSASAAFQRQLTIEDIGV